MGAFGTQEDGAPSVLLSSASGEWGTPQPVFDYFSRMVGGFDLDACASKYNRKVPFFYSSAGRSCLDTDWAPEIEAAREDGALPADRIGRAPVAWMNPVYGDAEQPCKPRCKRTTCAKRGHHCAAYRPGIFDFVTKATQQARRGVRTVVLVPSRTDTVWFDVLRLQAETLLFIQGRLSFVGCNAAGVPMTFPAPFASAVAILSPLLDVPPLRTEWIKAKDLR